MPVLFRSAQRRQLLRSSIGLHAAPFGKPDDHGDGWRSAGRPYSGWNQWGWQADGKQHPAQKAKPVCRRHERWQCFRPFIGHARSV